MNRLRKKRQWYAQLLLCVFVPMLMLASVHVHQPSGSASTECYACLHHLHHDGHISSNTLTINSCLLCHFLTTPYVAATVVAVLFAITLLGKTAQPAVMSVIAKSHDANHLRAPPVCL